MIQNTSNTVVLTLREVTTLAVPYYVFNFVSDDTNISKVFTGVDISTNVNRYNEFVIELNSVEDLENSITELVESGKVYVDGLEQLTKVIYSDGNDTKVVYNG